MASGTGSHQAKGRLRLLGLPGLRRHGHSQVPLTVGGAGVVEQAFRVSGPLGFFVAKIGALVGRDKPKDAYDIVWLLEAWPGGPEGAAAAVRESVAFWRPDVQAALGRLATEFADASRVGPAPTLGSRHRPMPTRTTGIGLQTGPSERFAPSPKPSVDWGSWTDEKADR